MRLWRRKDRDARPDPNQLQPPEGVPLYLPVAGVGVRMGAQITDIAITSIGALALVLVVFWLDLASLNTIGAISSLMFFIVRIPYYVVTELIWNGQTLGKRIMKIKVVAHDGGPLTTYGVVLRNLMKEAEVFLPMTLLLSLNAQTPISSLLALAWTGMALAIPIMNRYRRRLGDFMAGTHVVHLPQPRLMDDLATTTAASPQKKARFTFLPHQLDHYGTFELQTLEGFLRADGAATSQIAFDKRKETLAAIVEKIREKIGYADPIGPADHMAFLNAFYSAQRAHLEQRQLFGDRRADKHHSKADEDA
ncbi:MAG: RDD family protein [Pseudomonadota bacterium]